MKSKKNSKKNSKKRLTHLFVEVLVNGSGWCYIPLKKSTFDEVSFNPLMSIERNLFTPFNTLESNEIISSETKEALKESTEGIMWYYLDLEDIEKVSEFFNENSGTYKCLLRTSEVMVEVLNSMYSLGTLETPKDFKNRIRVVYGVWNSFNTSKNKKDIHGV